MNIYELIKNIKESNHELKNKAVEKIKFKNKTTRIIGATGRYCNKNGSNSKQS